MPFINFEVTEEEKEILDKAASKEHMKATAWARSFVLRGARQINSQDVNEKLLNLFDTDFFKSMMNVDMKAISDANQEVLAMMNQIESQCAPRQEDA